MSFDDNYDDDFYSSSSSFCNRVINVWSSLAVEVDFSLIVIFKPPIKNVDYAGFLKRLKYFHGSTSTLAQ